MPRPSFRLRGSPTGLTLVEVMVATVIFSVGALGLAAASATIVRQMALNSQRTRATSIAGTRSEQLHSALCPKLGSESGVEWTLGLRSEWSRVGSAAGSELDHRVRRLTPSGTRDDQFLSGVPCE